MPKPDWGIDPSLVDDFDREGQYKPYAGPIPPDGVYRFKLKQLKYAAGTKKKHPQMRPGLELVPRGKDEKRYAGYYVMDFIPVSERTEFRYVPFLDALGVSGKDFVQRIRTDDDDNITKMGSWRNNQESELLVQLRTEKDQEGKPRQVVKWYGAYDPDADEDADYDEDDDDDDYDEDEDDDD